MANHLKNEHSPYLQQHADNPVDWYPWGEEAFKKARDEHKPVFLSIGYSSCHWCHVMEHESFQDEKTAKILNKYFVSIKVDREERPDIDKHFQSVYQLMNGRPGGWPTSIFLTEELKPFYSATYIPDEPKYGMMSFSSLLEVIADKYNSTLFRSVGLTVVEANNEADAVREARYYVKKLGDVALVIVLKHLVEDEDRFRKELEDLEVPLLILPTRWAKAEPINVEKLLAKALGFG